MFSNIRSIKSKIFLSYGAILIVAVVFSNFMFYSLAKRYFYNNTIQALESISRDVIVDDIEGKNLKNGVTLAVHKYKFSIPNVYIQARYKDKVVLKSKNMRNLELPKYDFSQKSAITFVKISDISKYELIIYATKIESDKDYTVQIATTNEQEKQHLSKILHMFLVGDPIFILVILLIIYKMLLDILKPMNTIIRTAKNISITDLDKRIPYKDNGDEFAELAKTFNKMLSRLQSSFDQIKRFSSDASHQLKTPLTSMRVQTDVALKMDRDVDEYKKVLKSINGEIIYLQEMINDLFLLTQMDDEIIQKNFKNIDLDNILMNAIGEFVLIANKKGVNLDIKDIKSTPIKGENTLVSILCSNLIDNAIKYTQKGKSVSIELKDNTVIVEDEGIGIKEEDLKHIFDKFFRVHSGRSEGVQGYGLGLSIVKIIANLHNAQIRIESKIGVGTRIEVEFPTVDSNQNL
ncbi:MAG: ATP-binding protein [Sulfurospirillaceae bacterium]|nr:ATP-binding protein [Sulfurospirillaceae bacterium]